MSAKRTDAVGLAERALAILDQGAFSATYKYALFIALIELCLEKTSKTAAPPDTLTTREVASKTIALYWPHAAPFDAGVGVLRQGGVRRDHQAEILRLITEFRVRHDDAGGGLLHRARLRHPDGFEKLHREVEWKLIEMPIPRLQRLGRSEERFLYEYHWDQAVRRSEVARYQRGLSSTFDNRLLLHPGVGANLVRLNGVLRPLIQREWARMVAAMNDLPQPRLEEFLFGATRIALEDIRSPLRELQEDRCFYCDGRVTARCDVDHFIPWARHPDNSVDNLVVAHPVCNNQKRDFLASAEHVERWRERSLRSGEALADLAREYEWARDTERTFGVARAVYLKLPDDARLWVRSSDFEPIQRARIADALAA